MTPEKDFDLLMVEVRLQATFEPSPQDRKMFKTMETASQTPSRQVMFYKYGGNGSLNPAIRLARLRRFNEVDFEHIQKFERIRDLRISDQNHVRTDCWCQARRLYQCCELH